MMAGMQHSSTTHITNTHPVPCMTPCRYIFTYVDFGVVQILLTIVVFVCFTWFVFSWFTGSHGFYLLDSHGFPLVSTAPHWLPWVPTGSHGVSPVSHFGKVCFCSGVPASLGVCVCVVGDYPSVFLVFWVFWWMALATEGVVAGLPKHYVFS